MRGSTFRQAMAGGVAVVALAGGLSLAPAAVAAGTGRQAPDAPARTSRAAPPGASLADPGKILGSGWRSASDRAVTVVGDATGLHVLVADESDGYAWRTIATLTATGADTSQWIGQSCVTGSGDRAVVVYAPRSITNDADAFGDGALAAVVNLVTGQVTPVGAGVSIAYFDPGCGTGEDAVLTQGGTGAGVDASQAYTTHLMMLDTVTGKVTSDVDVPGQVTSAVPYAGRIAGVGGSGIISIGPSGQVRPLASTPGTAFNLSPDASGGLGFEVAAGKSVQVRRFAAGSDLVVGTAPLGSVEIAQTAGRVFVTGLHATGLGRLPSGWRALNVPAGADVSTTGTLAVTSTSTPLTSNGRAPLTAAPDNPQPSSIAARVTATGRTVEFAVPAAPQPAAEPAPAPLPGFPGAGAPAAGASTASPADVTAPGGSSVSPPPSNANPATTTYDPDRTCSVPRNDPTIQAYQPSAQEIEWAVDQAVQGRLTDKRGPDLFGSGLPAYTPQGMFPTPKLDGGGSVPAQIMLGVLSQESAEYQASSHVIIGQAGNFEPSFNWYGDEGDYTYVDWTNSDCGYGIAQITTGMCMKGNPNCGSNNAPFAYDDQLAAAIDYQANIAAGLRILVQKWNQLHGLGITANTGNPAYIEDWWFALWAYNSGLEPSAANGNTTGCSPSPTCTDGNGDWGLGWVDNPANKDYPPDRPMFLKTASVGGTNYAYQYDLDNPQKWSYEEKVIGFAYYGLVTYNFIKQVYGQAYAKARNLAGNPPAGEPLPSEFCTDTGAQNNHCDPANVNLAGNTDANNPCQLTGNYSDHCWWHKPITWIGCGEACGTQVITYGPGAADPGDPGEPPGYAPECSSRPLPSGAVIVGDVPSSIPAPLGCGTSWKNNGGSMSWQFAGTGSPATYPSKIDFHQIGGGYTGHFWFTHTIASESSNPAGAQPPQPGNAELQVTGTWKPPSSVHGWTRIEVAIPDEGAWDPQANYQIKLGNGNTEYRVVNQAYQTNTWLSLGFFDLSQGSSVSLSNVTFKGLGFDIAWGAMAFIKAAAPKADYVAIGDSYAAGEGLDPYVPNSDYLYAGMENTCHRSAGKSYPQLVKLPGQGTSIAQQAANPGSDVQFSYLACSGVLSPAVTENALDLTDTGECRDATPAMSTWCGWDFAGNTDWTPSNEFSGGPGIFNAVTKYSSVSKSTELPQADRGWLSPATSLVTITQGGDDARFSSVMTGCVETDSIISPDENGCSSSKYYLTNNGVVDPEPLYQFEPKVISAVGWHLEQVYAAVAAAAPNARIVVIGYPRLFAGNTNPTQPCAVDLASTILIPDVAMLNKFGNELDAQVAAAVAAERAAGVKIVFINPAPAFDAHEVCSPDPWINGVVNEETSKAGTDVPGFDSFHLQAAGEQEYATLIDECLAGRLPAAYGSCKF
jgi:hypothetical protein